MQNDSLINLIGSTRRPQLLDNFLQNTGNYIYYVELTQELLLTNVSPKQGREYNLSIQIDDMELDLGKIVYVGEL